MRITRTDIAVGAAILALGALQVSLVRGDDVYVVDLDLPGVWKSGESRELFVRGSNLLRKPMNRPRCLIMHP